LITLLAHEFEDVLQLLSASHGEQSEPVMLYMVIETFKPGLVAEVYRRFRDRGRMAPEGLVYITSWVDLEFRRCFQVMETDNKALFNEWTENWTDLAEFEIVPIRTSDEAAAIAAKRA